MARSRVELFEQIRKDRRVEGSSIRELLFQIITEREQCASIAVGTNLPFS